MGAESRWVLQPEFNFGSLSSIGYPSVTHDTRPQV